MELKKRLNDAHTDIHRTPPMLNIQYYREAFLRLAHAITTDLPPVNFLISVLKIWKDFKILSHFMQKWIQPPACLDHILYGQKLWYFFPPNSAPKMPESQQLFFGLPLVGRIFEEFQHPAIQTKIVQPFGGFFQQIKVPL
jgi:hypothetical protein